MSGDGLDQFPVSDEHADDTIGRMCGSAAVITDTSTLALPMTRTYADLPSVCIICPKPQIARDRMPIAAI